MALTLGSEIGRGALGRVVRVHDAEAGETFAGKILHASHRADARATARFRGEAELVRALRHPNVVRIHGLEAIGGEEVLVMELVEGPSLATLVAAEGRLAEARAAALGGRIAAGLAAAHRAGLVHRDLKPANILVASGDVPKIVDFGLARATSFAGVDPDAFAVVGTPDYMAPEAVDPLAVDTRSDLYALGCVLHELIAGAPPFAGPTAFAILEAHRDAPVPDLAALGASPELARLIAWLLAKSPADRPQSAAVVARALDDVAGVGTALVARGRRGAAAATCAACDAPAIPEVPVCFDCGAPQVSLERGRHTVFVTGPGKVTHKLDADLRQALLDWLRANPSLGLDAEPIAKKVPRLPFVVATGVSEASAELLGGALRALGFEATALAGGRMALPAMRRKGWKLGGRIAGIVFTSGIGAQSAFGPLILPLFGVAGLFSLGAGFVVARRDGPGRGSIAGPGVPPVLAAAVERVAGATTGIQAQRHRQSLRAVVQRVLEVRAALPPDEARALEDDLAHVVDLAVVAATRVDELDRRLEAIDLRDPSDDDRVAMHNRDTWAARLLEMSAFLDALRARYGTAAARAEGREAERTLDELRAHIEALEEVESL